MNASCWFMYYVLYWVGRLHGGSRPCYSSLASTKTSQPLGGSVYLVQTELCRDGPHMIAQPGLQLLWVTFKPARTLLKPSWNLCNTHQRQSWFLKLFNEFRWVKRYYNCWHVEHTEVLLKLQHLKHNPNGMRNICRALVPTIISLKTSSRQWSTDGSAAGEGVCWESPTTAIQSWNRQKGEARRNATKTASDFCACSSIST